MRLSSALLFLALMMASVVPARAQDAVPVGADREAAQAAYTSGDFAGAENTLDRLLREAPDDPDLLRRMASVQAALGNLAEARRIIDEAAVLAPQDADIAMARANILFWNGQRDAARRLAAQIREHHGDYPGLDGLERNIARKDFEARLRVRSVSVGQSFSRASFERGEAQDWGVTRLSAAAAWEESSTATVEIEREERQVTDTRLSGRIDLPVGPHRIFLAGSATFNPDFRESWSLAAGTDLRIGSDTQLLADARFAEYLADDVIVFGAGIRQAVTADLSVTGRTIHLVGGGDNYRFGGSLRADYRTEKDPSYFLILASYPDAEIDGTRQLRAIAGGIKMGLSRDVALRLSSEYESREDSYERLSFGVDLSWSFRAP